MTNLGPKVPKATPADYEAIQGGIPNVSQEGDLKVVTHDYPGGEGMTVKSHIDHGTINMQTPDGTKEFEVDLLRQFHGALVKNKADQRGERVTPEMEKKRREQ